MDRFLFQDPTNGRSSSNARGRSASANPAAVNTANTGNQGKKKNGNGKGNNGGGNGNGGNKGKNQKKNRSVSRNNTNVGTISLSNFRPATPGGNKGNSNGNKKSNKKGNNNNNNGNGKNRNNRGRSPKRVTIASDNVIASLPNSDVTKAVQKIVELEGVIDKNKYRSNTIAALTNAFATMPASVVFAERNGEIDMHYNKQHANFLNPKPLKNAAGATVGYGYALAGCKLPSSALRGISEYDSRDKRVATALGLGITISRLNQSGGIFSINLGDQLFGAEPMSASELAQAYTEIQSTLKDALTAMETASKKFAKQQAEAKAKAAAAKVTEGTVTLTGESFSNDSSNI